MKFLKYGFMALLMLMLIPTMAQGQTNYTHGFEHGVVIQGMPVLNAYGGNVYWVDSGSGSAGNPGTFKRPISTLDAAVGKCTSNNGDIIMIKPGHTESITAAGGLDLDVAGITVIGLGAGTSRPTFTLTTATTADVDVDAANITVSNAIFKVGVSHLAHMIDVNASDCALINIKIDNDDSTYVSLDDAVLTDANADRLLIDGFEYQGKNQPAALDTVQTAISIVGGDDITIKNFNIDGYFNTAAIENVTTAAVNLRVYGDRPSFIRNRYGSDVCVTCVTTTSGYQGPNIFARLTDNAANVTEAFVGADMQFMQPIRIVNLDGESSIDTNITASTDAD